MREGAMSNLRNCASAAIVAGLSLLAPIIGFAVVVTVEMLGDLMAQAGATAIWPVVAGAMAWVLLRQFGRQPHTSGLRSEGGCPTGSAGKAGPLRRNAPVGGGFGAVCPFPIRSVNAMPLPRCAN